MIQMSPYWFLVPIIVQASVIFVDEFYCHHRRGLPLWERVGHPIDTTSILVVAFLAAWLPVNVSNGLLIGGFGVLSSLIITKDEWVHAERANGFEQWLHSLLFVFHPMVVMALMGLWLLKGFTLGERLQETHQILWTQVGLVSTFLVYQVLYWNLFASQKKDWRLSDDRDH